MLKYIKEYRFYIVLFLFLLIPVIAIDTSTRNPRDYKTYDKAVVAVTAPIQILIRWTLDGMTSSFQNYIYLLNTRKQNLSLLEENRKLLGQLASLKEAEQENTRLRKMLGFEETFKLETVIARVIAKDISSEFRAIRINRGENSGIHKDMAVLTHEGIVGRVLRSSANTADVVTILDLLSAVDAVSERSRARGIVEGLTDQSCQLKYANRTDDIQVGDSLVTSGLGGVFPKGIPIGVVTQVNKKKYGISQDVELRPSVDLSRIEEVMVLKDFQSIPVKAEEKPSP